MLSYAISVFRVFVFFAFSWFSRPPLRLRLAETHKAFPQPNAACKSRSRRARFILARMYGWMYVDAGKQEATCVCVCACVCVSVCVCVYVRVIRISTDIPHTKLKHRALYLISQARSPECRSMMSALSFPSRDKPRAPPFPKSEARKPPIDTILHFPNFGINRLRLMFGTA